LLAEADLLLSLQSGFRLKLQSYSICAVLCDT